MDDRLGKLFVGRSRRAHQIHRGHLDPRRFPRVHSQNDSPNDVIYQKDAGANKNHQRAQQQWHSEHHKGKTWETEKRKFVIEGANHRWKEQNSNYGQTIDILLNQRSQSKSTLIENKNSLDDSQKTQKKYFVIVE